LLRGCVVNVVVISDVISSISSANIVSVVSGQRARVQEGVSLHSPAPDKNLQSAVGRTTAMQSKQFDALADLGYGKSSVRNLAFT
jgi:hypothetical protein